MVHVVTFDPTRHEGLQEKCWKSFKSSHDCSCGMQVRDAALLASGKCAASFPEECRGSLSELYKLWTGHLDDNIPSVRADAAAALGDALQAYKQELLEQLLPLIR